MGRWPAAHLRDDGVRGAAGSGDGAVLDVGGGRGRARSDGRAGSSRARGRERSGEMSSERDYSQPVDAAQEALLDKLRDAFGAQYGRIEDIRRLLSEYADSLRPNATDEPRRPLESAEVVCRDIGRRIAREMPKGWGFALVLFSFGADGFMTCLSNAERSDMVKALRECAEKIETGKDKV